MTEGRISDIVIPVPGGQVGGPLVFEEAQGVGGAPSPSLSLSLPLL